MCLFAVNDELTLRCCSCVQAAVYRDLFFFVKNLGWPGQLAALAFVWINVVFLLAGPFLCPEGACLVLKPHHCALLLNFPIQLALFIVNSGLIDLTCMAMHTMGCGNGTTQRLMDTWMAASLCAAFVVSELQTSPFSVRCQVACTFPAEFIC